MACTVVCGALRGIIIVLLCGMDWARQIRREQMVLAWLTQQASPKLLQGSWYLVVSLGRLRVLLS